ncbi:MAG: hypothetical protein Tsb0020_32660 [Haliangiales bacterium]
MKPIATLFTILSFAALLSLGGCSDAEELYNCASICESYDDCADELGQDVDVTDCIDECEDESDASQDYADAAAQCEACLDESASCQENFPCADECAGVVPELVF